MSVADLFKWQSLPNGDHVVPYTSASTGPRKVPSRQIYGRIAISDSEIADWKREHMAFNDRRAMQRIALRQRLGMNDKQIARVMRRLPGNGAFLKAMRAEVAGMVSDLSRFAPRPRVSFWERLLWTYRFWMVFRG